jgi:hypothetical protein
MHRIHAIISPRPSAFCGILLMLSAGCDLLNQTPIVKPGHGETGLSAPLDYSRPDSVLKMIEYVFDQHAPQSADDFGDLLYEGYFYRYDGPTDEQDVLMNRDAEISAYRMVFDYYDNIEAQFDEEHRWVEYGQDREYPAGTLDQFISPDHPTENWIVLQVLANMSFTFGYQFGEEVGSIVRQRFDLAFRLKSGGQDSVWQLASWTDHRFATGAKTARAPQANPVPTTVVRPRGP